MKDTTTERVGRYQLLEPIGVGPCGAVSRAKVFGVAGFERQFAVKRFHPELTITAALAQALSAAARSYGSLEHPRIARMSEFGVAQGQTFTAVEYVPGLDALRLVAEARLGGTSLAAGGALALVSQAARAVGYAHGRGLVHLGLAPTNVIVTADGDVKITDFAVLAAGMPQRPTDVARLAQRIQYLSPEQLANEATSAATDVFALGVIAYELVTGQRTFSGETPQQVAQAIMAGPPVEPSLPRPIVRVLQRCLARSPFERFPDARALADALDAALRVAPVPGTRKDIGVQVKDALDRIAALHEGEMSGVLALNIGTGPIRRIDPLPEVSSLGRESQLDVATSEFVRPDTPVAGPTPLVGPATTVPDVPKAPMTTMTGLPPMPIPVPQGLPAPPPIPRPAFPTNAPSTLVGIANAKPPSSVPPIKPPSARTSEVAVPDIVRVPRLRPPAGPAPRGTKPRADSEPWPRLATESTTTVDAPPLEAMFPDEPSHAMPLASATILGHAPPALVDPPPPPPPAPPPLVDPHDQRTSVMSPHLANQLSDASTRRTNDTPPPLLAVVWTADPAPADPADDLAEDLSTEIWPEQAVPPPRPRTVPPRAPSTSGPIPTTTSVGAGPIVLTRVRSDDDDKRPAPKRTAPTPTDAPPTDPRPTDAPSTDRNPVTIDADKQRHPPAKNSRKPMIIAALLLGATAVGIGGWQLYNALASSGGTTKGSAVIATAPVDAAKGGRTASDAGEPARDAAMIATTPGDAVKIATAPTDAAKVAAAPADAAATVATVPADAAKVATAPADAAKITVDAPSVAIAHVDAATTKVPGDAAVVPTKPDAGTPVATGDMLTITSTPAGAHVYLDGAESGVTPLKLPGSGDRHTIALLLAGHELYIAQVDGHGAFAIPLKELTPVAGTAGIKVIKCKDKDRYYVFVDGKPTGQMCPTERIETEVGAHTVEVYDAGTESRKKWDIVIKDTRLSYRVRIE